LIICEIIVHLLVILQNNKQDEKLSVSLCATQRSVQTGNRRNQRLPEHLSRSCRFSMQADTGWKYANRIELPGSKKDCEIYTCWRQAAAKASLFFLVWGWSVGGHPPQWDLKSNTISASFRVLKFFSSCSQVSAHTDGQVLFHFRPHYDVNSPKAKSRPSESIYHSTNALRETPFVIYINCYMFRHRGAILRELQQRCMSQHANMVRSPL